MGLVFKKKKDNRERHMKKQCQTSLEEKENKNTSQMFTHVHKQRPNGAAECHREPRAPATRKTAQRRWRGELFGSLSPRAAARFACLILATGALTLSKQVRRPDVRGFGDLVWIVSTDVIVVISAFLHL